MFQVAGEAYDRFMGRYSRGLSAQLADLAVVGPAMRVLDVGCGPGALVGELVGRVGPDRVAAVDPSEPFVGTVRQRYPGVDVRVAAAERIPFADDEFDAALAQLVVHFMRDPVVGLSEMARVTRPGGVVAACVWDHASDHGPLGAFWKAARDLDPLARDESGLAGVREGHLAELFGATGQLERFEEATLVVRVEHPTFHEWWEPFTQGVGPAGAYVASLEEGDQEVLRGRCRAAFPTEPFTITARAWAARGVRRARHGWSSEPEWPHGRVTDGPRFRPLVTPNDIRVGRRIETSLLGDRMSVALRSTGGSLVLGTTRRVRSLRSVRDRLMADRAMGPGCGSDRQLASRPPIRATTAVASSAHS